MHSNWDSTLDGLQRVQAETDLRMGHQGVYVYGGGRGRGQRGGGRASFLPRLSLSRNAKWRGWWARHADPWHPAVQCKGKRERPFWRPSILANQPLPLANLTTSQTPPLCAVCGVCVCSVPSLPIHLEIMHPPSPSAFFLSTLQP